MVGRIFSASSSGTFTHTVSPLASELITRTCSQRSPWDAVCAYPAKGDTSSAAASTSEVWLHRLNNLGIRIMAVRLLHRSPAGTSSLPLRHAVRWRQRFVGV